MHYDLILAGGGLANGLIAWRLSQVRPELNILCLEQADRLGGNHTWSFHDADLSLAQQRWIEPLVVKRWPAYRVHFPALSRTFACGYASLDSDRFAEVIAPALGARLRTACEVASVHPDHVQLASGERLQGRVVIDGRGARPSAHRVLGHQAFLGQVLRLQHPHGLQLPVLMDARVIQGEGYRFVYLLPFSDDTVLIEDTHYVDGAPPDADTLRGHIAEYVRAQGWSIAACLREEQGVLPITLAEDVEGVLREANGQPCAGLRAGLFHSTTGYSLPDAVRLAYWLATQPLENSEQLAKALGAYLRAHGRRQRFYRLLNRMLFLAGRAQDRWGVLQRFHGLSEPLIARFYAGRSTWRDQLRILSGKPPVPVAAAIRAALRHSPRHFKDNP
ncbi:lycopene beta-cyclase CrtY [Pseudomonas sp. S75]|uniref:lycopene beta-cyclase CrtY n=1 Tax=unclassified Pseudomonas TaxID=196821 RepID=UPI001907C6E1|nr:MULTISPECIES: lycopene beta-cyclase CrtY [unclassified Pseudomonas]MBJ9975910.1 lycopene beta-cyclase CrtY [Pseudomonas sp. S30]MBK0154650.1 lycopene beta-cyclase CrtY [Pseudomonas sp. S75]